MPMTPLQIIIMILTIALGTALTRFTPFLLFPETKKPPAIVTYLGQNLPAAMMGLLVIYCLRNVSLLDTPHGLPEILSIAMIVVLHKWKNNVLLSIGGGTLLYMVLVQRIFI